MIGATLYTAGLVDRLAALPGEAEAALLQAADRIAGQVRDIAQRNLSGGVLKARTETLRASLQSGATSSGRGISGFITADTRYAGFQEYGFAGAEDVRAFLKRQTVAFGRPIRPVDVSVRAHGRRMDYPAHSYLRAALAEIGPTLRDQLAAAMAEAVGS